MKSTKKERQKLKPKVVAVRVSKKQPNRLRMYGFPRSTAKPVQKSTYEGQRENKDEPKIKTVSRSFSIHLYFKASSKQNCLFYGVKFRIWYVYDVHERCQRPHWLESVCDQNKRKAKKNYK